MERILCAAIWYNDGKMHEHQPKNIKTGYVMCGRRHHNIVTLHFDLTGKPTRMETCLEGFVTSYDRFVNRVEANTIAIDCGQSLHTTDGDELFSEDLY